MSVKLTQVVSLLKLKTKRNSMNYTNLNYHIYEFSSRQADITVQIP